GFSLIGFLTAQNFTFENPNLHTDDAVGGAGLSGGVINMGPQGVERHSALAVPLGTGDLGAAQAPANLDLVAFGTMAHAVLHGALHVAAEHHTTLQLLANVLGHQRGIQVGLAHFLDVAVDRHTHLRGDSCTQLVDILALLANHHAG